VNVVQYQVPALLLSLALHLGAGMVIGPIFHGGGEERQIQSRPTEAVNVRLDSQSISSTRIISASLSPEPQSLQLQETATSPSAKHGSDIPAAVSSGDVSPSRGNHVPRYFKLSELTEKPLVVQDVPDDLLRDIPGVSAEPMVLRLFINELGRVDRVAVESSRLSEAEERRVIDAFQATRFEPGKVGRLPVKSQLRIEVLFLMTMQVPATADAGQDK
jgi:hypothetical protein